MFRLEELESERVNYSIYCINGRLLVIRTFTQKTQQDLINDRPLSQVTVQAAERAHLFLL